MPALRQAVRDVSLHLLDRSDLTVPRSRLAAVNLTVLSENLRLALVVPILDSVVDPDRALNVPALESELRRKL